MVHDRLRGGPVDVQKRQTRLGSKVGQGLGRVTMGQIAWRRVLLAVGRYVDLESDLLEPCRFLSAADTDSVHRTQGRPQYTRPVLNSPGAMAVCPCGRHHVTLTS